MGKREARNKGGIGVTLLLAGLLLVGAGLWVSMPTQDVDVEADPPVVEEVVPFVEEEVPVVEEVVEPEPEPEPEEVLPTLPEGTQDWQILIANKWNPVDGTMEEGIELTQLANGHQVDSRCYPYLQAMMDDCTAAGYSPYICSSYRPYETQERLYNNKVARVMAADPTLTEEEAMEIAATEVAVPGTSEHQICLTVDIVDANYQILDDSQADTPTQQWLMEHCWEYGFILRYPLGFIESTGIIYEPWHYRYVGVDIALEIRDEGTCLEDYLAARGLY